MLKTSDSGLIPGSGRSPGGGHSNLLQYYYLENPHGQRNLVSYSPWGCKELDTTEHLSTAQILDKIFKKFLIDLYWGIVALQCLVYSNMS